MGLIDEVNVEVNGSSDLPSTLSTYTTKILKPNIVGEKNILTQALISSRNTKYVIKWNFDLDGKTITVPEKCVLEFDGGSLKNGTIIGQDTFVNNVGGVETIFGAGITQEGTWRYSSSSSDPKEGISRETADELYQPKGNYQPAGDYPTTPEVEEMIGEIEGGKDKEYNPAEFSGLGKVYLKKNIVEVGGVEKNILTQSAFYKDGTQTPNTDTVFVVQYDFDLNGQTVNVPANCVLEFNGGSLSNGTIVGDYTTVNASICEIFKNNLIVDGDFNNVVAYPEWFGAKGDGVTDDTLAIQRCIDFTETIGGGTTQLGPKQYEVSSLTIKTRTNLKGRGQGATILHSSTDFRVDNAVPDNTGIVVYPNNVGISVVSDMTILGTGYHQNGISVIDKANSVSAPLPGQYGIFENRKALQTLQAYKDTTITNVYVGRCNYGIVCRRNGYRIVIDKCNVKYCVIGIEFTTTDSSINECYIENCQKDGLSVYGGNNKVTNIKSIWNGAADPLNSYGIRIGGNRHSLANCEVQDNYCSGIIVMGTAHTLTNVLANGDGIANEASSPDKIAEIRAKDNVDGQGLTEWAIYTVNTCFNNCIATNYIYSPNRGIPKYTIRYDASHPQTLGTDIKIYGNHLMTLAKNPIYPDTPIRNTHTFNIIEENYNNTKGYKLQNERIMLDIPLREDIDTFNIGVICEFIPEDVVEQEVVFSLFGFYGLYIQPFESDAELVNGGKRLQLFPAMGDRYPSYNSFKMENVDVNKPIRVFMRANYLKTEDNIAKIECLTCLWYYTTAANCYVYALARNTVPYDLYIEGGVIQGDFRDYKADSLGFRRSVSYLNAHGATENTVYLRKLVATYDTCIPDTVSYPGYPLYNLNPEFAFDYLTLRTDRRNQYSGPTAKRPQYVSTGNFYYDENLNMPVCYIKGGWSPVGVVPIGNVTPTEGGTPVIENTINANDLEPGTIGAYTRGDAYKDTYNYPFGYCYVLTFCIIPNNNDYLVQLCVPKSDNSAGAFIIPENQKNVKYRTKVDGVWSNWYPSSPEINKDYMYISNNRVVCLNSPKLVDGSFAKYTDVVMDDVVTKCIVRHVLVKEDTQGIDPMIALIARPNKYDSNSNAANGGVVKDSVHVAFHKSYLEYGIFNNGSWSHTRINYPTITFPEGKTEIEVVVGFEITGNDTIVFTLPDGSTQSATVTGIRTHSGKYFTFEHYIYSSPDEVSDKYVLPITGIYCRDASGKELIDDFRRENGPLGVAPTGQVYIQYNPFQTKDTFPLNV